MYCRKCGKENKSGAKFCAYCGAAVVSHFSEKEEPTHTDQASWQTSYSAPNNNENSYTPYPIKEKSSGGTKAAGAIIAVVVILIIVIAAGNSGLKGTYASRYFPQAASFGNEGIEYITFKAFGQAEIGTAAFFGGRTIYEDSEYRISGNKIKLIARWGYSQKQEEEYDYNASGNSVFIDGVEYIKSNR